MLDTGPLGLVTHPKGGADAAEARAWLRSLREAGVPVRVPEIADYELRRELLRAGKTTSLTRLDRFGEEAGFLPLTSETMRLAAELWAEARRQGHTTAPDPALDGDVILAAQARLLGSREGGVVVATTNVGHLSRFVDAKHWREIEPPAGGEETE